MTTTDLQKLHTRLTARSTELVNLLIDLEEITTDLKEQGYNLNRANKLLRELENFYRYPQIRKIIHGVERLHEWLEGELETGAENCQSPSHAVSSTFNF